VGATLAFGVFSFLALREFITLAHTRRSDHRSLILAFFIVLPLQYVLVGQRSFDLFTVFIPVYVFLAIRCSARWPATRTLSGAQRQDPVGHHGLRVRPQHAPALLLLDLPRYEGRGAFLCSSSSSWPSAAQIVQELASRWLRRRPLVRHIDRSFSLRAWLAGRGRGHAGRGFAVLDHAGGPAARRADGGRGRQLRRSGRPGHAGPEEGRGCALLGQPVFGHRCRGLAGPGRAAVLCGARVLPLRALVLHLMLILGIDPGLQKTGFGVIEADGPRLAYRASGTISTLEAPRGDLPLRLKIIFEGVREVVQRYRPDCATVEIVFVNVNPQSTLLLGQARGAALAALVSEGLAVSEYTALQMKKAIVGHGLANKSQVQEMVRRLLALPGLPGKDAADALGLAIAHAHAGASLAAMAKATTLAPRAHAQYRRGRTY
jgi:crossover junction endodeoxyribonuclease RuvC